MSRRQPEDNQAGTERRALLLSHLKRAAEEGAPHGFAVTLCLYAEVSANPNTLRLRWSPYEGARPRTTGELEAEARACARYLDWHGYALRWEGEQVVVVKEGSLW